MLWIIGRFQDAKICKRWEKNVVFGARDVLKAMDSKHRHENRRAHFYLISLSWVREETPLFLYPLITHLQIVMVGSTDAFLEVIKKVMEEEINSRNKKKTFGNW